MSTAPGMAFAFIRNRKHTRSAAYQAFPRHRIMHRSSTFLIAATALLTMTVPAAAQTTAQTTAQNVGITVGAVSIIAVQGTTALIVGAHKGGTAAVVSTASATYAITTNEDNRRLSVSIDEPLPLGVTMTMNVAAPAGGVSCSVNLSSVPQTAVSGISRLNASGLQISYTLATASGARLTSTSIRNVTMTIESASEPRRIVAAAVGVR